MTAIPETRGSWAGSTAILQACLFWRDPEWSGAYKGRVLSHLLPLLPQLPTSPAVLSGAHMTDSLIFLFPELFKCPMKTFFPSSIVVQQTGGKIHAPSPGGRCVVRFGRMACEKTGRPVGQGFRLGFLIRKLIGTIPLPGGLTPGQVPHVGFLAKTSLSPPRASGWSELSFSYK